MKPNDISNRAWEFAWCLHDFEPGLLEPGQYEHDECVETARAFDKATADLRGRAAMTVTLTNELAGYSLSDLHPNDFDVKQLAATLAAYTPGESK